MLFILSKRLEVIDTLSNKGEISNITPFFDDEFKMYLGTGAETFKFSTLANTRESQHLVVGNYVAFKYEGKIKLFNIVEIQEEHNEQFFKTVYCEMAGIELLNNIIRPTEIRSASLTKFLEFALADTSWDIGLVDLGLTEVHDFEITSHTNTYSLLQQYVIEKYGGEISLTVEIEGGIVTKKLVNVFSKRGKSEGFRFAYSSNLSSVIRTVDSSNLATAIIGIGNNNIDFKEVEALDKPLNQDFIADEESYKIWSKNGEHIFGYEKFDTDSPQELLKLTRLKLEERRNPYVKYELKTELLGDSVQIGDEVLVQDTEFNPPIFLSARVNELTISFTDPNKNECLLSNFKEVKSNISAEMREIAEELKGVVDGKFPIGSDQIQDGAVNGDKIDGGSINNSHIVELSADKITTGTLDANKITVKDLTADSITTGTLDANKVNVKDLTADSITSGTIDANIINVKNLDADNITSGTIHGDFITGGTITGEHIASGSITSGSGIIANGSIGSAQISDLQADKISGGTIDTSKVSVIGANGHLQIRGNRLQVFEGLGNQAFERVSLGDVDNDGSTFGLRVRGKDGKTILLDENGVTEQGITDGSITNEKISGEANIDGAKLDIKSVVREVNNGTETIIGTKISVGTGTLDAELSKINNTQTEQGTKISNNTSSIKSNTESIKLKVDTQTYTTDKKTMTEQIQKNTSSIDILDKSIALKVEATDIKNAIDGVVVGGRNYLLGTGTTRKIIGENRANQTVTIGSFVDVDNIKEKTITTTVKYKVLSSTIEGTMNMQTTPNAYMEIFKRVELVDGEHTLSHTMKLGKGAYTHAQLRFDNFVGEIEVSNIKVEIGNKPTDYSKAIEEVEEHYTTTINNAKSEIKATTDSITSNVSNLETTTQSLNTKVNNALDKPMRMYLYKNTKPSWSSNNTPEGELWLCGLDDEGKPSNISGYFYRTTDGAKITVASSYINPGNVLPLNQDIYICFSSRLWLAFYNTTEKRWKYSDINDDGTLVTPYNLTLNDTQQFLGHFVMETGELVASGTLYDTAKNYREVTGQGTVVTTRLTEVESKITDDAITNTVKKNFYTKEETEGTIVSKGYQTDSQVQQTVNNLQIKFEESGGYNLLKNSTGLGGSQFWVNNGLSSLDSYVSSFIKEQTSSGKALRLGYNQATEKFAFSHRFLLQSGKKYTVSGKAYVGSQSKGVNVYLLTSNTLIDEGDVSVTGYDSAYKVHEDLTYKGKWVSFTKTIIVGDTTKTGVIRLDHEGALDTTVRYVYFADLMIEEGELSGQWTPHPNEVYGGITTIDKDGVTVKSSSSNTYTVMDSSSFRVEDNKGGTIAEFSATSNIPDLNTNTMVVTEKIEAPNIWTIGGNITFYVDLSSGNDTNIGTSTSQFKTIQKALDTLPKIINDDCNYKIVVKGSGKQEVRVRAFQGSGQLQMYFENGTKLYTNLFDIRECTCRVRVFGNETWSTSNAQFIQDDSGSLMYIRNCGFVQIDKLCLVGSGLGKGTAVNSTYGSNVHVNSCEISRFRECIKASYMGTVSLHNSKGSDITYIADGEYYGRVCVQNGAGICPSYTDSSWYDGDGRSFYYIEGSPYTKTEGDIYKPSTTPPTPPPSTSNTRTWSFNKIWSDETLNGWSNRNELIQGYYSGWDTGRWTGYLQMSDDFSAIRTELSGATNLSGRIYVQRTSSSGNATGSKLCLYGSDGTTVTTTQTIDRGKGVWVTLSSAIVTKIQSGAIKYFYLKADTSSTSTYFKCESNAKIELTYTK